MIYNGKTLLSLSPIKDMLNTKVKHNGVSHGLVEAGYDIRLAEEIVFFPPRPYGQVLITKNGIREAIGERFVLGSSIEEFQMPSFLLGLLKDKSTWARQGVSVFNTVIEPGWHGFLTIEIVFNSNQEVIIPAGSGIGQVLFYGLTDECSYSGKYQNQKAGAQPAKFE